MGAAPRHLDLAGRITSRTGRASWRPIPWVYAEIARVAGRSRDRRDSSAKTLTLKPRRADGADRARRRRPTACGCTWCRPIASGSATPRPPAVHDAAGNVVLVNWAFNGWAKYDNWQRDVGVGQAIAAHHRPAARTAAAPRRSAGGVVLEGGGIEVNGDGLLLVTEEWLLSDVQVRNPGLTRADYEQVFRGMAGRQTDDLARRGLRRRRHARPRRRRGQVCRRGHGGARGRRGSGRREPRAVDRQRSPPRARDAGRRSVGPLRVVTLPYPRPVLMNGERLPASYANFYIANGVVLVPTFNDANDRIALNTLAELMPSHRSRGDPRRRSGVGTRNAPLPHAAGAAGKNVNTRRHEGVEAHEKTSLAFVISSSSCLRVEYVSASNVTSRRAQRPSLHPASRRRRSPDIPIEQVRPLDIQVQRSRETDGRPARRGARSRCVPAGRERRRYSIARRHVERAGQRQVSGGGQRAGRIVEHVFRQLGHRGRVEIDAGELSQDERAARERLLRLRLPRRGYRRRERCRSASDPRRVGRSQSMTSASARPKNVSVNHPAAAEEEVGAPLARPGGLRPDVGARQIRRIGVVALGKRRDAERSRR